MMCNIDCVFVAAIGRTKGRGGRGRGVWVTHSSSPARRVVCNETRESRQRCDVMAIYVAPPRRAAARRRRRCIEDVTNQTLYDVDTIFFIKPQKMKLQIYSEKKSHTHDRHRSSLLSDIMI